MGSSPILGDFIFVLSTIKDKSVDAFEQNKRFLFASFRNFKKVFFVDS